MANQIYVQGGIPHQIPPYEHQEYPKWLCRYAGTDAAGTPVYDAVCVETIEERAALGEGWEESQLEAFALYKTGKDPAHATEEGHKHKGRP